MEEETLNNLPKTNQLNSEQILDTAQDELHRSYKSFTSQMKTEIKDIAKEKNYFFSTKYEKKILVQELANKYNKHKSAITNCIDHHIVSISQVKYTDEQKAFCETYLQITNYNTLKIPEKRKILDDLCLILNITNSVNKRVLSTTLFSLSQGL